MFPIALEMEVIEMDRPLRGDKSPIPRKLQKYLNETQLNALGAIEKFGWTVAFVRRPLYMPPTVFMVNRAGKRYGILLEDGTLDQDVEMDVREESASTQEPKPGKKAPKTRKKMSKANVRGKGKPTTKYPVKVRA